MPLTLVSLLLSLTVLAGCVTQEPESSRASVTAAVSPYPTVEEWLQQQQQAVALDTAQVVEQLSLLDKDMTIAQLYYYGILNQQLQTYGAWTVARDTFKKIQETEDLPEPQRQLASILRQYNQNRINAYARQQDLVAQQAELQQQLEHAGEEKRLLEQKIQALTALEAAISTRKEE
jgi:hypothetical protein